jgi:predicted nicotinamide N-methyase
VNAAERFVRTHTRAAPTPLVPEVRLGVADDVLALWEDTERLDPAGTGTPGAAEPPFWAFPWAGGQALARHVLDHPQLVAGRRVLDLACGSGLVAVAAALAGAASVRAVDVDPLAVAATTLTARRAGVAVSAERRDVLDDDAPGDADVVLAGDVFYDRAMAARVLPFLRRAAAAGADVLVGDPGRRHLPGDVFTVVARYDVPTHPALEDVPVKATSVLRLPPTR